MASQVDARSRLAIVDERVRSAVEAVAATDPNPTDPFRGLYISDDLARTLARESGDANADDRLDSVAERLALTELETGVLGLCAAPELSPRYGRLFAYLHDDVTRKLASPRLATRLLAGDGIEAGDVLRCFARSAPLRRFGAIRLLETNGPTPIADCGVKVADRVAAELLGARIDDATSGARLRRIDLPVHDLGRPTVVAELRSVLGAESAVPLMVAGPDAQTLLAIALGQPLLVVSVGDLLDEELLREAALAAALEQRRLCFDRLEELEPSARRPVLRALVARDERPLLSADSRAAQTVLGDDTVLVVEAPMPSLAERKAAWSTLVASDDVGDVAAKFRLSIGRIAEAAEVARLTAQARGVHAPAAPDLDHGARQASSTKLGELARRLDPAYAWEDLVLPERQLQVLKSISAYLRHRDLVLSEWGYDRTVARTQGLKVLFAGESGTGKTMAGQVLARELGLDLFRIDLATTVSKYIGETEKNLDRIFAAAEGSNAILFFDEADALFGKRSEVHDSHDRYANIETAYLLQKMEGYEGAVILATNFRQNMDDAFLRRLDVVIDFPFPEAEDRERIWRLVLPEPAPRAADIDVAFLAAQFKLAGGGIRNCSLAAAFLAAEAGEPIGMRHLVRGVALEYGKLGRLTLEADFERFHELIRSGNGSGS